jgi:2,3-bisphosphoglycerate-independent phosphoglycerate mutase
MQRRFVALVVLDGWGYREKAADNAISLASTPFFDRLWRDFPRTLLEASGERVGLPHGQMGNSEVGHLNLGAGRVVFQDLERISRAVRTGEFAANPVLVEAIDRAVAGGKALHLAGLVSDGGVHSLHTHLYALLRLAKARGLSRVHVHALLDGRDTPPSSGKGHVEALVREMAAAGVGDVATVMGRYWAMDRDNRWDRVEKAYAAMVRGEGREAPGPVEAVEASYRDGKTDEFMEPAVVRPGGRPASTVSPGDSFIFFNFRADRAREITRALTDPAFDRFPRPEGDLGLHYVCMTSYDATFPLPVAFPAQAMTNLLADSLASASVPNLRIAETEKYAHVTYFFNGGVEKVYPGESRLLVPSPKVATYDLQPEMSAPEVAARAEAEILSGKHGAMILNFANCDMVGHTGILPAAIRAVEAVDAGLRRVVEAVWRAGGAALVTADHGNAERMRDDATGEPHTAHTTNPVPCVLADPSSPSSAPLREGGALEDVSPTLLALLGLPVPPGMSGTDLRKG